MRQIITLQPIDYLMIGHLTQDILPNGFSLGGTAAFAALTAKALGMRVGIVTAWGEEIPTKIFDGIPIINYPTEKSTTFKNFITEQGRRQTITQVAPEINLNLIPEVWHTAPIVHLGPVAQEVAPNLVRNFPDAFLGITPQGWLRSWDREGNVSATEWPEASFVLSRASAAVLSFDDVSRDEHRIEEFAIHARVLAITEAADGARLYWHGDIRRFRPPQVTVVDDTGAGDIFAAAFFVRLNMTRDPWEAARFATQLAAFSVTRRGLDSIPTPEEIQTCLVEVL